MSEFHATIISALDKEKSADEVLDIVESHLIHLNKEFNIEHEICEELKEYYKILKEAKTYIKEVINNDAHKDPHFDWSQQWEQKLRKAHELILDIEKKLKAEGEKAKDFLE